MTPSTAYPGISCQPLAGFRWQIVPECRDVLLGPAGFRLAEWLQNGQAQVVKQAPHRMIYKVELPPVSLYVKHYPLVDASAWLKQHFRPSKVRSEFHKACEVARRGIATFTPLAIGEHGQSLRSGECVLVSLALDNVMPLDAFLLGASWHAQHSDLRQRLAVSLAKFVARMHEAGVRHDDFHPGNVLLRWHDDEPEFFLIDLHAVRLGPPLSWAACRDNLAMLNNWFAVRASRSDRLRFWTMYCRERHINETDAPIGGASHRRTRLAIHLRYLAGARDRRCLGSNRYFQRLRGLTPGYAVADLDAELVRTLRVDPEEPFRRPGIRILKNSRSSSVIEFTAVTEGTARRLIYKRFNGLSVLDGVRRSQALRSWYYGQCLRDRFLPTPRPLLVLQRRGAAYLLTEKIEDALHLHDFLAALAPLAEAERRACIRSCVEQTARMIRELHRHGYSHRDLKACNILVNRDNAGKQIKIWLIDLAGVEKPGRLSWRRRFQNLARLHASFHDCPAVSNGDKLRFLRIYLQCGLFGSRNWKQWWQAIAKATLAKIARNRRIGRPLA